VLNGGITQEFGGARRLSVITEDSSKGTQTLAGHTRQGRGIDRIPSVAEVPVQIRWPQGCVSAPVSAAAAGRGPSLGASKVCSSSPTT